MNRTRTFFESYEGVNSFYVYLETEASPRLARTTHLTIYADQTTNLPSTPLVLNWLTEPRSPLYGDTWVIVF